MAERSSATMGLLAVAAMIRSRAAAGSLLNFAEGMCVERRLTRFGRPNLHSIRIRLFPEDYALAAR